jgi:2-oxoglutarate dehydrogenase E2 component (dihydrolipoamide succinyltransferase)
MAQVELLMPKMGESIFEATILTWIKKPGDKIEQDESVLEVATDKVDTEVPTTQAGILTQILAKEGEVVKVGSPIAIITTEGDVDNVNDSHVAQIHQTKAEIPEALQTVGENFTNGYNGSTASVDFKSSSRFYCPLVNNIAKEENIYVAELEKIPGKGAENNVNKKDIIY